MPFYSDEARAEITRIEQGLKRDGYQVTYEPGMETYTVAIRKGDYLRRQVASSFLEAMRDVWQQVQDRPFPQDTYI